MVLTIPVKEEYKVNPRYNEEDGAVLLVLVKSTGKFGLMG